MTASSLRLIRFAASLVLVCGAVSSGFAVTPEVKNPAAEGRDKASDKTSQSDGKQTPPDRVLDKELELGVLQMVNNHLPEIKVLLDQLRDKEPRQYQLAIQNLAKSARRLQTAKKRGEESFELEVHVVQAQSSINLLIAKLKVRDSKADRKALREATRNFELAEIARASYDVAQLKSRIDKMTEQLESAKKRLEEKQSEMDETIEKDFQSYLRKSGRK